MVDSFKREITYLRLSITDRCNLRCQYCMPQGMTSKLPHEDILTYEEFLRLAEIAVEEGVSKIRLTGGEPLVRRNFLDLVSELHKLPGLLNLCLTTNGILLSEMAEPLAAAGIGWVNISLDSLKPEKFQQITGFDNFHQVWQGVESALSVGFEAVKINVVAIRGMNDQELIDFARLTLERPLDVRFIEYMPMGAVGYWSAERFISSSRIKENLSPLGPLTPVLSTEKDGPVKKYRLPDGRGTLGFISALSDHFCASCNRIRLTADGKLRLCLHSNRELDLKTPLRQGATREELTDILRQAVRGKPAQHHLGEKIHPSSNRSMNLIGG
ncbi:MAG: GTP 3',8-cyclase MoaA [Deltaproteobacteria bacterium]|nr:GTP 3',8-cyclase MoaA [Deltaproteobacteria bacterium]